MKVYHTPSVLQPHVHDVYGWWEEGYTFGDTWPCFQATIRCLVPLNLNFEYFGRVSEAMHGL